jgi:hypothetical protein
MYSYRGMFMGANSSRWKDGLSSFHETKHRSCLSRWGRQYAPGLESLIQEACPWMPTAALEGRGCYGIEKTVCIVQTGRYSDT